MKEANDCSILIEAALEYSHANLKQNLPSFQCKTQFQILQIFGAEQDKEADLGGGKDQKIPLHKTQSFKDKKKAQNWFQRQFSRNMSHDHDSLEIERATAIAAAVLAISSQEFSEEKKKKKINEDPEGSFTKIKSKVGGVIISQPGSLSKRFSGSFRSSDDQGNKASIFPSRDEKKPEKALTLVSSSSMKKTSTSSEQLNTQDHTKPEAPPPRKTPTFGDKNLKNIDDVPAPKRTPTFGDKKLKNIDDTKPRSPEPKFAPPVQSASSRPILPPPPPPHIRNTSIEPGPVRPPTPPMDTKRQTPTRVSAMEAKANAWEREELEKIKQRYEKLKETIDSWESKKKAKARRKLEKKEQKSDSEGKKARSYEKFQSEMQYINGIAGGARAQAEERRRNEELKVKEKANIIRTTGKLPATCPCF
ncbi:remorin-like isoform X1 [Senna tora]|uniref:Remorin-like isoform X1 n=1 Tax=Senna tora TaxID=362788 RepID=A0A834W7Z1_9FABA|nr:remorin-like isoform X1 [Senna tora]